MPTMEADIEVLKTQVKSLCDSVEGISSKIDSVLAMQEAIVRLQEQHGNTREALERAFKIIGEVRDETEHTASKINQWATGGIVAFVLGGVIVGLVQWYAMKRDNEIDRLGDTLVGMERRISWIEHDKYGRGAQEPPKEHPQDDR